MKQLLNLFAFLLTAIPLLAQQDSTRALAYRPYLLPAVPAVAGVVMANEHWLNLDVKIKNYRDAHYGLFHTNADDYLVFVPALSVYALDAFNVPARHDVLNQTVLLTKTTLLTGTVVTLLKYTTSVKRPDGSANNSFPSGHTAMCFAYATVLKNEFRKESVWPAVFGYTLATSVGAMRVLNNRHWASDVLVGAATGILCTELMYATHRGRWKW